MRTKTMNEIATQYAELRIAVKGKMEEIISTNGKIVDGDYSGKCYVPSKRQQKKLETLTDRKIISIGISNKVSGGIYVETDKRAYTAFDCIPFQVQYNIISVLTDNS